ncbi:MAG TPA: site-specific integrase [Actinomycetes bacterium]|nr:site-specific integrase [Actinomycetes bacterium]
MNLGNGARRVELVVDVGEDPATGRRRQTRRRFTTVDAAIEAYSAIKGDVRKGVYVGKSDLTVRDICQQWLGGRHGVRPTTLAGYRHALKPVLSAYGMLPAQRLAKKHLDELIKLLVAGEHADGDGRRARPWKPRTVNLMLFVLGKVLDAAVRQGVLHQNVATGVDRLAERHEEVRTYSQAEVRRLLRVARHDRLEHVWHLALYGLRRGEVCGLSWQSDIDFTATTLTVRENRVLVDGSAQSSDPKSERGKRTLPLTDALVVVLKRAQRRRRSERLRAGASYAESGYVVVDALGQRLSPATISDRWDELTRKAGVRRITLHGARHTCGTIMHLQGVPVAVISTWLGHADTAFTMRTYVHSQPEALRSAADVLGSL